MNSTQASSFISAMESAGIDKYYFVTDMSTNFHHNDQAIVKLNGSLLVNFRKPQYARTRSINGAEVIIADLADVHEARAIASAEQLKEVASTLGVSLTDEEYKLLIGIDKKDYDLIPATGNYIEFVFMPAAEYNKLSDEEKAKYDEASKFEQSPLPKFHYIGKNAYDMLDDTDKQKYDALVEVYGEKKAKELPANQAASIS